MICLKQSYHLGQAFSTRAYAEKSLPAGYIAKETRGGGWVGVKKAIPVTFKPFLELNQDSINSFLSDAERMDLEPDEPKEIMPDYSGLDIICPGCARSYHDTTASYDLDKYANSAMLQLKDKYRGYGWEEIIPDHDSGYGILVCPDCGAALAPSGKLRIA